VLWDFFASQAYERGETPTLSVTRRCRQVRPTPQQRAWRFRPVNGPYGAGVEPPFDGIPLNPAQAKFLRLRRIGRITAVETERGFVTVENTIGGIEARVYVSGGLAPQYSIGQHVEMYGRGTVEVTAFGERLLAAESRKPAETFRAHRSRVPAFLQEINQRMLARQRRK